MNVPQHERFFVITGGPGSGKTTLVELLAARGICTIPEAGRSIIQDQVATGGSALPWADRSAFAELMLSWELRSYREALRQSGPVAFDRGVPDVIAYLRVSGLPVPLHMEKAAEIFRYHPRVFIAAAVEGNLCRRHRTEAVARRGASYVSRFGRNILELNYELIQLPLASAKDRVQFVIESIGIEIESA
jgi:predicted ATPase